MKNKDNLVWYVSYGSNLSWSRFLCYIQGGTPKGAKRQYAGCTNKSLPLASGKYQIKHQIYFAKNSPIWGGWGVAFIKSNPLPAYEKNITLGRKYLITKGQFIQVVRQENGKDIDDSSIELDFDVAEKKSQCFISPENECTWYGRIINLGTREGVFVFTVTAKWSDNFDRYNLPSDTYLKTIIEGLREIYVMTDNEIIDYLISIPGIYTKKTCKELEILVRKVA